MSQAQSTVDLSAAFVAGALGFRNRIINGNLDYWQRNNSFSNPAGYCADRMIVTMAGGATGNCARTALSPGNQAMGPARYCEVVNITNGGTATDGIVIHAARIENVDSLLGTITASVWLAANAGQKVACNFAQVFGTGGSTAVRGAAQVIVPSNVLTKYAFTFALPSIVGKTIGTNSFLEIGLYLSAGSNIAEAGGIGIQAGNFSIAQIQLEPGGVVTPFEARPPGLELSLCQRYYEILQPQNMFSGVYAPGYVGTGPMNFKQTKRTAPTVQISNIQATILQGLSVANTYPTADSCCVVFNTSSANNTLGVVAFTAGIDAEI